MKTQSSSNRRTQRNSRAASPAASAAPGAGTNPTQPTESNAQERQQQQKKKDPPPATSTTTTSKTRDEDASKTEVTVEATPSEFGTAQDDAIVPAVSTDSDQNSGIIVIDARVRTVV